MERIFWMFPGRLAGRPGPGRAPWSVGALREAGFQSVLCLADDQGDPRTLVAAGLVHATLPLPATIPADAATERVCRHQLPRTFAFLDAQLSAGRQVLVHCAGGRDRTGLVLAHYVARTRGLAAEEALAWLRARRPDALAAAGWEGLALRLLRELAPVPVRATRRRLAPHPLGGPGARV